MPWLLPPHMSSTPILPPPAVRMACWLWAQSCRARQPLQGPWFAGLTSHGRQASRLTAHAAWGPCTAEHLELGVVSTSGQCLQHLAGLTNLRSLALGGRLVFTAAGEWAVWVRGRAGTACPCLPCRTAPPVSGQRLTALHCTSHWLLHTLQQPTGFPTAAAHCSSRLQSIAAAAARPCRPGGAAPCAPAAAGGPEAVRHAQPERQRRRACG